jgi:hypothetical protein
MPTSPPAPLAPPHPSRSRSLPTDPPHALFSS